MKSPTPKDKPINSLVEFLDILDFNSAFVLVSTRNPIYLYRGVSDAKNHLLLPSIGRDWHSDIEALVSTEKEMLSQFKAKATLLMDANNQPSNNLEWLVLGQHHGMPTRLLDWTSNCLTALYFACLNRDVDGAVYLTEKGEELNDPSKVFNLEKDLFLTPRHISPRITAQSGHFTISKNPIQPLSLKPLRFLSENRKNIQDNRVIIPHKAKRRLLMQLRDINISAASLFPGLDGLAKDISVEYLKLREIAEIWDSIEQATRGI